MHAREALHLRTEQTIYDHRIHDKEGDSSPTARSYCAFHLNICPQRQWKVLKRNLLLWIKKKLNLISIDNAHRYTYTCHSIGSEYHVTIFLNKFHTLMA